MINISKIFYNIMKCRNQVIGFGVSCTIITYLVCISGVLPFV
jgi:hypothetical protein